MIGGRSDVSPREAVDVELGRLATRLATLGPARLARPAQDGVSRADRVRPVLQELADRAADLEGRPRRPVPVLAPHALADQLVVLVRDVLVAAGDDQTVLDDVHGRLVGLRRAL